MKIKMLIAMYGMGVGGVEKALLNFLKLIPMDMFEINILFLVKEGEYLCKIPDQVKISELKVSDYQRNILLFGTPKTLLVYGKKMDLGNVMKTLVFFCKYKYAMLKIKSKNVYFETLLKGLPYNREEYDVALDFFGHFSFTTYYVSEKMDARVKVTWIHSEKFDKKDRNFLSYYSKYNKIYGVSKACVNKFKLIFPECADKIETFYNIMFSEDIIRKSYMGKGFEDNYHNLRILTVGRLDKAKGCDLAIQVAADLKYEGFRFRWYVIGEGNERKYLEKLIHINHLDDTFILLGNSKNPYPYIKECDIYIQPSRYEGYCLSLAEARLFHRPIIATDFSGAREQIKHAITGYIVNFNRLELLNTTRMLMNESAVRETLIHNLEREPFDISKDISKILKMFNESRKVS